MPSTYFTITGREIPKPAITKINSENPGILSDLCSQPGREHPNLLIQAHSTLRQSKSSFRKLGSQWRNQTPQYLLTNTNQRAYHTYHTNPSRIPASQHHTMIRTYHITTPPSVFAVVWGGWPCHTDVLQKPKTPLPTLSIIESTDTGIGCWAIERALEQVATD